MGTNNRLFIGCVSATTQSIPPVWVPVPRASALTACGCQGQCCIGPLESLSGAGGAGPGIRPTMHFEAVAHAESNAASVNSPLMPTESVAAVGHSPFPFLGHHCPQGSPARLPVQIGGDCIPGTIPTIERWQVNQASLPPLEEVSLLRHPVAFHQRKRMHPPGFGVAPTASLAVVTPPDGPTR